MKGWQTAILIAVGAAAFLLVLKSLLQSSAPVIKKQSDNPLVALIDAIPQVVGAWRSHDGSSTTSSVDAVSGS